MFIFIIVLSFYNTIIYNYQKGMTDKAKYASHGVFIKKMSENFLGKWDKPKNAVINPIPTTKPR